VKASQLFRLPKSLPFSEFFDSEEAPWEWVSKIERALLEWFGLDRPINRESRIDGVFGSDLVFIHESVKLPSHYEIAGPCYIGEGTEVRPGAYIRGNVIVGRECVLGNSCEYKNCLLMDRVETAHFNYIGDSVLGSNAHLGAGAVLSNLRLNKDEIRVTISGRRVSTGRRKLGALLGEGSQVGCNAVLQPGTILGKGSMVLPAVAFGGSLPENAIAMIGGQIQKAALEGEEQV
tara:strand:+ start:30958 stop:31656 length:699 start_codon:yes stop_codon:yes gene_type:complete